MTTTITYRPPLAYLSPTNHGVQRYRRRLRPRARLALVVILSALAGVPIAALALVITALRAAS